jgi:diguanylate cyclase (GGDEF)-like protein
MEGRERLKHLGLKDALTGINNRRFFDQRLLEEVSRAQRDNLSLTAVFIDIDHFKAINDQHGHKMGDIILQQVARSIRVQLRTTDTVARYGGEEFVALLCADTLTAVEISERIRANVHKQITPNPDTGEQIQVSVSLGLSSLTDLDRSLGTTDIARQLIHLADTALYHAKTTGRNRTIIYQPGVSV